MSDSQSGQRELVYCHQCENEWYRDEHGLICPACQSEFTEVIEANHDPRNELHTPQDDDDEPPIQQPSEAPPHPPRDHNPWANENGHGMDRLRWEETGPGRFRVTGTIVRQIPASGPDPFSGLMGSFESMVQQMTANNERGNMSGDNPDNPDNNDGPRVSIHSRSGNLGPFGFYSATTRLTPRDANQPQMPQDPTENLHRLLANTIFGASLAARRGGPSPFGDNDHDHDHDHDHEHDHMDAIPMNPILGFLEQIINPAAARRGDAVYTQEALDRVITQLMEQNAMGSAPGPANATEISQLPKVQITQDMMDQKTGKASCSICMDEVEVGMEVTRLWCRHWFHEGCVGAWLREHDSCPQCRKSIAEARDESQGRPQHAHQNIATETGGSLPTMPMPMPGAFGYPRTPESNDAPPEQSRQSSSSGRGSTGDANNEGQHNPGTGFADRMRNIFTRNGSSSNANERK